MTTIAEKKRKALRLAIECLSAERDKQRLQLLVNPEIPNRMQAITRLAGEMQGFVSVLKLLDMYEDDTLAPAMHLQGKLDALRMKVQKAYDNLQEHTNDVKRACKNRQKNWMPFVHHAREGAALSLGNGLQLQVTRRIDPDTKEPEDAGQWEIELLFPPAAGGRNKSNKISTMKLDEAKARALAVLHPLLHHAIEKIDQQF